MTLIVFHKAPNILVLCHRFFRGFSGISLVEAKDAPLDGPSEISGSHVLIHGGGNGGTKTLSGRTGPASLISSLPGRNLPQPVFSIVSVLL